MKIEFLIFLREAEGNQAHQAQKEIQGCLVRNMIKQVTLNKSSL
jgi:hypothetical protein